MDDDTVTQGSLPTDGSKDDGSNIRPYQDDTNTDDDSVDPLMVEENDDPVEVLQVPSDELKDELDQYAFDESPASESFAGDSDINHGTSDDRRELIEDMDEGDTGAIPGSP